MGNIYIPSELKELFQLITESTNFFISSLILEKKSRAPFVNNEESR